MSEEIIISCPGGKCPIKKSCLTWNKPGATMMPVEPFHQNRFVITCSYFELKPSENVKRVFTEPVPADVVRSEEKKDEGNTAGVGETKRATEAVATSQGQLFA